jgi:2-C-methyl-D-erythritol 4-phosphate cytidylyltransferase
VACAAWALGESGATLVDIGTEWSAVVEADRPLVLHDTLCPMTPAAFLAECVHRSSDTGHVVVGVRPVTDTVKVVEEGYVGVTLDRDLLVEVASPVVLPAAVVRALDQALDLSFPRLVAALAQRFPVDAVTAPADARRVRDADDVAVLEALTRAPRPGPRPPGR